MLAVFACTPNQLQQNQEYDDVYFTASDRAKKPTIVQNPEEVISSNQKALVTSDFSSERVDANLVSKYNNGVENEVVYFEEARVTRPSELNYDDFVYDYENNNLAYYELPLDWQTDWDRNSFNQLVNFDFQFQNAWYDQYYLGSSARMNNYLSNSSRRLSRSFNSFGPRVGLDIGFSSFGFGTSPFFAVGMRSVNLNPYGFYDPFFDPFWGNNFYGGFNNYYGSIGFGRPWGWNNYGGWNRFGSWNRFGGYNNYFASNVIYINNSDLNNANRRTVSRGGRISSTSVSSVRADAINGTSPSTRSGRLASTSPNTRSSRISSSSMNDVSRGSRASSTAVTPTRSSRVSTNAYQFSGSPSSTRSSSVRNNTVRNTSSYGRSPAVNTSSARSSSNLFTRSSSSRTATPSYSRSNTGNRTNSFSNSRSSSSRNSSFSNNRSSSSSSRSSGSVGSSSSRSSSSSSSRGGSSSSSSSRSSSSSSSSSRSGRGN